MSGEVQSVFLIHFMSGFSDLSSGAFFISGGIFMLGITGSVIQCIFSISMVYSKCLVYLLFLLYPSR